MKGRKNLPTRSLHRARAMNRVHTVLSMRARFLTILMVYILFYLTLGLAFGVHAGDGSGNYVILTFDDGYQARSGDQSVVIMREFGYRGVLFVPAGDFQWLGTALFNELKNEGWEIGGHTWTHARCDQLTMQELRHELIDSKIFLEETFGVQVVSFGYTHSAGEFNETVNEVLAEAGYLYARGDDWDSYTQTHFYGWSGEHSFQVNSYFHYPSNYQNAIEKVIQHSKTYGYSVASFHGVNSKGEGYEPLLPDQFRYCLQRIKDSDLTVIAFQDLEGVEPEADESPTSNLLANPSTEMDNDANGVPDGWTFYKTQNMLATCSWSSDSHTGTHAIKITSTYNPSTTQKQSALWCQQINKIVIGETYRFRVWYQANIQSTILLLMYSKSSIVEVKFLDLPPSTSWTQSTWLTATTPSTATSLRVDCRLFNKYTGWAIFDDLELVSSTPPEPEPPEPESPTPETNLVLNPSVDFGNGQPNYWDFYKTSNMIATVSWVSDAHSGSKAVRIEATYNPNGKQTESALWHQNLAQFSVGKTYKFRVWYKASVQSTILLLAFDKSKNQLRVVSLNLAISSSYRQSAWLSITVPSGTTTLRADARLFNRATGWAVFDDFELVAG